MLIAFPQLEPLWPMRCFCIFALCLFLLNGLNPSLAAGKAVLPETPNGKTLIPSADKDGIKRCELTIEPIEQEILNANGKIVKIRAFGFNGTTPGPTLVFTEGDHVAITVINHLPESTTVHWHGVILPNRMDGAPCAGESSPMIKTGETFTYEFIVQQSGTHMYHTHTNVAKQNMLGLAGGLIFLPKTRNPQDVDRDIIYFLHEWKLPQHAKAGAKEPGPTSMSETSTDKVISESTAPDWKARDFNFFTMNGKAFPSTDPINVKKSERIRVRFYNVGIDTHPIHLHGQDFWHTEQDGNLLANPMKINTITVAPGQTQAIEIDAINPGVWPFHCHIADHATNNTSSGMGGMATVLRVDEN